MLRFTTTLGAILILLAPALPAIESLSPAALLDLWEDAEKAYDERDAATAIALFEQITRQSPQDPEGWFGLSTALAWSDEYAAAAAAAERSYELGFVFDSYMTYRLAQFHAKAGQEDKALHWISASLDLGYRDRAGMATDPDFSALHEDPGFIRLTGLPTDPQMPRDAGLAFDLDYLVTEAQRLHADPDHPAFSEEFLSQAQQLRNKIAASSDAEVVGGFMRLLATLNDGHTGLYGPDPDSPLELNPNMLPVKFYWFDEGVYIIDDATPDKALLGQRITKIGEMAVEDVLARMAVFRGVDNAMTWRWMGPQFYLGRVQMLQLVGATESPEEVQLTLVDSQGKTSTQPVAGGDYNFRRKLRPLPGMAAKTPLYLSRVDDQYWLESIENESALYFQFNQVRDKEDESIEDFSSHLAERLAIEKPNALIIDVRHNNGGNNMLVQPLVKTIIAYEQASDTNRIFVLTGRNTFSAAQNFVNRIEQWTDAVFVGEPSASSPNFVGEETTLLLPYSRMRGSISNRYWQDSQPYDQRDWISPRLPVAPTAADYFAGRDAALEAVLEVITGDQDH